MLPFLLLYKQAYQGLSRQTWYLSLVILINRSGTMVVPFMTMYATQRLGFSITEAGIIMALFGAGAIVGAFIGGRLTDAIGFHKVQLFALFGGGLMFIVVGYLTTFPLLAAGTFVLSVINESFRPANSTAIAYYSNTANRTRSYSLNRLAINLGWAFGGALGGFLAATSYHLLFWVDGLTNISAGILLFFVLPAPVRQQPATGKEVVKPAAISAYKDKPYLVFIFLTILFAFCFFQMFTILPVYLKQELGLTEKLIGTLMAINGLIIAFIEMVLVYRIEKSPSPLRFIKYGVWLVGISYGLYNLLEGQFLLALLSVLVITVGEMLSMPFMNTYWISRSSDHNRGQYAALYTMAWGTAQVAAPSVGGFVADQYSFAALWWLVLFVSLVAGTGFHFLTKRK
ncbi:MDR family MFS transporter [Aridibaculum aurantiacum]|uniref:MDR family MFS transporter n=1 Tax=Aridibaculum aurantiacum TaxID=2810307 RepID=UPI001A9778A4|nr:MFS transporter [Aridibaculum aurantiacum]